MPCVTRVPQGCPARTTRSAIPLTQESRPIPPHRGLKRAPTMLRGSWQWRALPIERLATFPQTRLGTAVVWSHAHLRSARSCRSSTTAEAKAYAARAFPQLKNGRNEASALVTRFGCTGPGDVGNRRILLGSAGDLARWLTTDTDVHENLRRTVRSSVWSYYGTKLATKFASFFPSPRNKHLRLPAVAASALIRHAPSSR